MQSKINYDDLKTNATPMMLQYFNIKENHPNSLLFYRMGDFYELFYDDAIIAADILNIALTSRGKDNDKKIPMCGVPHHSYEPYLNKLIKAGHKVAVCEQMESPDEAKKRGYKSVVKREVVRVITPGTILEDNLLNAKESNFLVSLVKENDEYAIAWIDISTGEFKSCLTYKDSITTDVARLEPKEILLSDKIFIDIHAKDIIENNKKILTLQPNNFFDKSRAENHLKKCFDITTLESLNNLSKTQIIACGSLIEYISLTQKNNLPRINLPQEFISQNFMTIDISTRKNLELIYNVSGQKKDSLLHTIDKTITNKGARLFHSFLLSPLRHASGINERLNNVDFFYNNRNFTEELRQILKSIPDFERALSRICIDKSSPRDLNIIKQGLQGASYIFDLFKNLNTQNIVPSLKPHLTSLNSHLKIIDILDQALKEEVGAYAKDGHFIKEGFNPDLDKYRQLSLNAKDNILQLRDKYREVTKINNLKINRNNVIGYFIDITPANSNKMQSEIFNHRQTLANSMRYSSDELQSLEMDINNAADNALNIELNIYQKLNNLIKEHADIINLTAINIATIDVFSSLAILSLDNNYTRPIVSDTNEFIIEEGRHPVIENIIKKQKQPNDFVNNDCDLGENNRLWLLTGPNMSGKSTFLRQNAIIAIMAQIGSHVPAKNAYIGTIDKLFSRVGASDDLAKGHSTFMVEMIETASILNQATEKSLVILDEIGRGTATYDGLSIAWAVVEYLHNRNKSRALFATHYHELTSLIGKLKYLRSYNVKIKEWKGNILFLHKIVKGSADKSYGIHVAKLAGLPKSVIKRSQDILSSLEKDNKNDNLPLINTNIEEDITQEKEVDLSYIEKILTETNIDNLSPKQALDLLYDLKNNII